MEDQSVVSCFLVKIASRCNLDCDYCYMYHHADQSWRKMPAFLSAENEELLALRISEYAQQHNLARVLVVYHGGEPLLAGMKTIERITSKIRAAITKPTEIDFSLQTNGTLVNDEVLDRLEALNISVSLSIDGPDHVHNKHRIYHSGKPSYQQAENALRLLSGRPKIFTGVIAVIDPEFSPQELLEFFSQYSLPSLDFLLPDANYQRLPPAREQHATAYLDWLIRCFDLWFDEYAQIPIRFFDAILRSLVGMSSNTDALGFGDVSLLTIETDGTYHDLDVLKVAFDGASNLRMSLADNAVEEAMASAQIALHRSLLKKETLCEKCQACSIVDICSGGSVPHRYSHEGFNNPSIYCDELYGLIHHIKARLDEQLEKEVEASKTSHSKEITTEDLSSFEDSERSLELLQHMVTLWGRTQREKFEEAVRISRNRLPESETPDLILGMPQEMRDKLSIQPSVLAWTNVINAAAQGTNIYSIAGNQILPDYSYLEVAKLLIEETTGVQRVNRPDPWLRLPFGEKIKYESEATASIGVQILNKAYDLIDHWDNRLLSEIKLIAPEVQFIKDETAHPDKIVSFSDNSVPGALYVTIRLGEKFIEAADLADSILHEYRHQKLYLLQRISDVVAMDVPLVPSPWREELRPPSGLFHAVYVFSFLRKFWAFLSITQGDDLKVRAENEVQIISDRIRAGIATLKQTKLTETGIRLLQILEPEVVDELI